MATSDLLQATQNELTSRVSNHFIASRLAASADQEDPHIATHIANTPRLAAASSPSGSSDTGPEDQQQRRTAQTSSKQQPIQMPQPASRPTQDGERHHLQPAKHEDSDSSTASDLGHDGPPTAGSPLEGDKTRGVGPMGIFFKVWSLVKVTKSRHNRMKRQISEHASDPQHFQYVPGDQFETRPGMSSSPTMLALPRGSFNQHPLASQQRHLLKDAHFRRAGSQPPISSSSYATRLVATSTATALRPSEGNSTDGQLQINGNGLNNGRHQHMTATGTTGSSSGVSSTTSSTLATNYTNAAQAYDKLAAKGEPSSPQSVAQQSGSRSSGRSWTTRIKARASTGATPSPPPSNSSYLARNRAQQRGPSDKRSSMQLMGNGGGPARSPPADVQRRAQSEVASPAGCRKTASKSSSPAALIEGTNKPKMSLQHFRRRLRQDSMSDADGDAEGEEEEDYERETGGGRLARPEDDDDSDLNDIYSTPNDSIQSVPSGQMIFEQNNSRRISASNERQAPAQPHPGRHAAVAAPAATRNSHAETQKKSPGPYHMTKSFSSNYFSQLTEAKPKREADKSRLAGSTILETETKPSLPVANNNNNNNNNAVRANGSRFFISSSSSEDSNPPQAQSATTLTSSNLNSNAQLHIDGQPMAGSHQQQIPVSSGLHHHGPTRGLEQTFSQRPNSLAINSPSQQLLLLQPSQTPSVLTPNTFIMNGAKGTFEVAANVAAMSPMLCNLTNVDTNNMFIQQQQQNKLPANCQLVAHLMPATGYKKSPSLFDMNNSRQATNIVQRFSTKYPWAGQEVGQPRPMSSFGKGVPSVGASNPDHRVTNGQRVRNPEVNASHRCTVPNSVSLHDCKLASAKFEMTDESKMKSHRNVRVEEHKIPDRQFWCKDSTNQNGIQYQLAQMLLELGSNPAAKDARGCTALMHAIMSENLPAFRCLVEHGVDLNDTNHADQSALDLICEKQANDTLLEMLKLLVENQVDLDRVREADGSRLLDRLIQEHQEPHRDKNLYIDCLLLNGAKLGSSTWTAARGKYAIQLKLLKKLCQDGYFLYKKSCIEAAVFRFEYALKRIDELEQQMVLTRCRQSCPRVTCARELMLANSDEQRESFAKETQQAKYQTFLGLSRCERKRGFYKRALEFADMSILIDSTSYEGYYSKAHILKDIGERDEAILTIDQTERLVNKSIETIKAEISQLDIQEESLVFDGCFNMHDPNKSSWIETTRGELVNNLDYLTEAKKHIDKLRGEIISIEQS